MASVFLPAGTVNVPELLKVADREYANEITTEFDAEDAAEVPLAFVAVMVYVYVPATVSVREIGLELPVAVTPEVDVTVWFVIVEPPVALSV
jgi:hypothetical protein